ncbi:hypothetical protein P9112_000830 [Eukaryota sp. TZLM1-RC]
MIPSIQLPSWVLSDVLLVISESTFERCKLVSRRFENECLSIIEARHCRHLETEKLTLHLQQKQPLSQVQDRLKEGKFNNLSGILLSDVDKDLGCLESLTSLSAYWQGRGPRKAIKNLLNLKRLTDITIRQFAGPPGDNETAPLLPLYIDSAKLFFSDFEFTLRRIPPYIRFLELEGFCGGLDFKFVLYTVKKAKYLKKLSISCMDVSFTGTEASAFAGFESDLNLTITDTECIDCGSYIGSSDYYTCSHEALLNNWFPNLEIYLDDYPYADECDSY